MNDKKNEQILSDEQVWENNLKDVASQLGSTRNTIIPGDNHQGPSCHLYDLDGTLYITGFRTYRFEESPDAIYGIGRKEFHLSDINQVRNEIQSAIKTVHMILMDDFYDD